MVKTANKHILVSGLQYGDEGKGKISFFLGKDCDIGVKWNGGPNAGHTIVVDDKKIVLSQLPVTVFTGKPAYIAASQCLNIPELLKEIELVKLFSRETINLSIDWRTNLILPTHKLLDQASEKSKGSKNAIGSTGNGVGFAHADRTNRHGLRMIDILDQDNFYQQYKKISLEHKNVIENIYKSDFNFDIDKNFKKYFDQCRSLANHIRDISEEILLHWDTKKFLFESNQGYCLDYIYGDFPWTVAYHTHPAALFSSLGIPIKPIEIYGLIRAYTTRRGNGSLITEIMPDDFDHSLENANFKRFGWLDLFQVKSAIKHSGITKLGITRIDSFDQYEKIYVCIGYKVDDKDCQFLPTGYPINKSRIKPILQEFSGWQEETSEITDYDQLPENTKLFLNFIEDYVKMKFSLISVGPRAEQTIVVNA